jgi:hypothetical protein
MFRYQLQHASRLAARVNSLAIGPCQLHSLGGPLHHILLIHRDQTDKLSGSASASFTSHLPRASLSFFFLLDNLIVGGNNTSILSYCPQQCCVVALSLLFHLPFTSIRPLYEGAGVTHTKVLPPFNIHLVCHHISRLNLLAPRIKSIPISVPSTII